MPNQIHIPVRQLDEEIQLPGYAYPGDAGMDLRSTIDAVLEPFERKLIPCGFAMALPEGYAGLVIPRSGLAIKHGISVVNAPGLIDSNYRGEIGVVLINLDKDHAFAVNKGDRIAQLMVTRVEEASFVLTASLSDTERGAGGFGSSGSN